MKKYVIYTVLTGGYEKILQPEVLDERFDYILFTDNVKAKNEGVWSVRSIPDNLKFDYIRLSRYPKSHPVTLLSEYEASLYIDANLQIKDNWVYQRFIELVNKNVEYAGIKLVLTGRECIYDHAFDMCTHDAEHDYIAIKQCHELFLKGFPSHFGLNENNVIFRKHTDLIKKVDEEWWYWITNFSHRDQFSFMYCVWKYKVPVIYFLTSGEDTRNSSHFNHIEHNSNPIVSKRKFVRKGILEIIRKYTLLYTKNGLAIWSRSYKSNKPVFTLYVLSYLSLFKNIPFLLYFALKKWFARKARK